MGPFLRGKVDGKVTCRQAGQRARRDSDWQEGGPCALILRPESMRVWGGEGEREGEKKGKGKGRRRGGERKGAGKWERGEGGEGGERGEGRGKALKPRMQPDADNSRRRKREGKFRFLDLAKRAQPCDLSNVYLSSYSAKICEFYDK